MHEGVECVPIIPWSHLVHIVKLMNKLPCYFYFKSVYHLNQSIIQFYLSSLNSQLTIQFHWPPWNPLTSHLLPVWIRTGGPSTPAFQTMPSMTPCSDWHATNQHFWYIQFIYHISYIYTRQLYDISRMARTAIYIYSIQFNSVHECKTKKSQSTMKKWDFSFVLKEWSESPGSPIEVHRERVPHGRQGVVEPSWTQCLCFGSWDVPKSVQARGWPHVGTSTGESWSRNALIG